MEQGAGCGGGGGTEQSGITGETASTGLALSWIWAPREAEERRAMASFHWLWGRWGDHPPRLRSEDGAGRPGGAHLSLTGLPLLLGTEPVPRDKSPAASPGFSDEPSSRGGGRAGIQAGGAVGVRGGGGMRRVVRGQPASCLPRSSAPSTATCRSTRCSSSRTG